MNEKSRRISILEEKHTISILLYLLDNGTSTKSVLYDAISTNPRMPVKLNLLESEGLITMNTDRFEKNRTEIKLTEKGKIIAELLSEIDLKMN